MRTWLGDFVVWWEESFLLRTMVLFVCEGWHSLNRTLKICAFCFMQITLQYSGLAKGYLESTMPHFLPVSPLKWWGGTLWDPALLWARVPPTSGGRWDPSEHQCPGKGGFHSPGTQTWDPFCQGPQKLLWNRTHLCVLFPIGSFTPLSVPLLTQITFPCALAESKNPSPALLGEKPG